MSTFEFVDCCCSRKASRDKAAVDQATTRRGIPSSSHSSKGKVGVGIVFTASDSSLMVASLAVDGPAEKSGQIKPGDILISIDNVDVRGVKAEDLAPYILGDPKSRILLGFVRPGEGTRTVELVRDWTVKSSLSEERWSNPLPPNHSLIAGIDARN
eukprot:CAMPEP_0113661692 /NCGR_PEP_ID=MMETSP0038_2-20120614/121_1 /TAXON_ID=2898 /ORGANISM="Cryptomonas paramecium" /LENGTH=155 /DNA_ID=CAMNT_0000576423 /DNA_START=23 /DNA_END=490 /DNA_ORIENTATION=+ /assembly_acc=CAM_ASM_000170